MRNFKAAILVVSVCVSCAKEAKYPPTSPFTATHVSSVQGKIVSQRGDPLDSVEVFVYPGRPGFGYATSTYRTNSAGQFKYEVLRMTHPLSIPQPDTVTAMIRFRSLKASTLVDGKQPADSAFATLTFVPIGQLAPVTNVNLILAVP